MDRLTLNFVHMVKFHDSDIIREEAEPTIQYIPFPFEKHATIAPADITRDEESNTKPVQTIRKFKKG